MQPASLHDLHVHAARVHDERHDALGEEEEKVVLENVDEVGQPHHRSPNSQHGCDGQAIRLLQQRHDVNLRRWDVSLHNVEKRVPEFARGVLAGEHVLDHEFLDDGERGRPHHQSQKLLGVRGQDHIPALERFGSLFATETIHDVFEVVVGQVSVFGHDVLLPAESRYSSRA